MTERDSQVLLEIARNEIRWYHFVIPEARNIVTDRVRTDVVRRLAEAGRVDIGTADPGHYSVPSLIEGPGSTSPESGPEAEIKTAYEWDADPRNGIQVMSWSDFGRNAADDEVARDTRITWEAFCRYRRGATIMSKPGHGILDGSDQLRGGTDG